jgi:hypothetical protein
VTHTKAFYKDDLIVERLQAHVETQLPEEKPEFKILTDDIEEVKRKTLGGLEPFHKRERRSRLCEARDCVLGFLHLHRIEFNKLAGVCRSAQALNIGLSIRFAQQSNNDRGLRILLDHPKELWRFLKSDRYNGDPIELASAMAGVLEGLSPRSSLDYFLARKNLGRFRGIHFAAMQEREARILASKKRLRDDRSGLWLTGYSQELSKPRGSNCLP